MKKVLITCAALLAFAAPSFAAGLDLAWTACATNGGTTNETFGAGFCDTPGEVKTLHATFNSPDALSLVAMDGVVDLQTAGASLPQFWRVNSNTSQTACNDQIAFGHVRPSSGCAGAINLCGSGGSACGSTASYIEEISGHANRGRFVTSVFRASGIPVNAGSNYFAFKIDFFSEGSDLTPGDGTDCAGCNNTDVAIVFNQLTLFPAATQNGPDAAPSVITGSGVLNQCGTIGGAGAAECNATPTKNRTWGALKSLYR